MNRREFITPLPGICDEVVFFTFSRIFQLHLQRSASRDTL
jgi:hypothetical protein